MLSETSDSVLNGVRITEWVIHGTGRDRRGCEEFIPSGSLRALAAGLDSYHAINLLEALKLIPDTGDWHGSLRAACEMRLAHNCDTHVIKPNQTAEQMADATIHRAHTVRGTL